MAHFLIRVLYVLSKRPWHNLVQGSDSSRRLCEYDMTIENATETDDDDYDNNDEKTCIMWYYCCDKLIKNTALFSKDVNSVITRRRGVRENVVVSYKKDAFKKKIPSHYYAIYLHIFNPHCISTSSWSSSSLLLSSLLHKKKKGSGQSLL